MIENKNFNSFLQPKIFKLCNFSTFSTVQNKIILDTISILSLPFRCERKKILYEKTKYMPTRNFNLYTKELKKLHLKANIIS